MSPGQNAQKDASPVRFAQNVLQLAGGAAATQVLAFLLAPIIARLYSPEAFGYAATFASVLAILTSIVTLRYEMAILLPERSRKAAAIVAGSLLVVVLLSGLLCVPLTLAPDSLWNTAPGSLLAYPQFLPMALALSGITLILIYWGTRYEMFGLLSVNRVVAALVAEAGRLAFGLAGLDTAASLIVANIVGVATGIGVLARGMRRQMAMLLQVRLPEVAQALRQYIKFPLFASWAGVLNTLSHQVTPLVLGAFFASQIVGYYAQANRVTITPLILLSAAITQVFARSAARARQEGRLGPLTTATARNMLRLAWYPAAVLFCLGPDLTEWFLGAPWAEAGRYAQILSIWMLTTLISDPLSALYAILERQELGLALNLALLVARVGGLAIGGVRGDPVLALALFAGSGAALNVAQSVLLVRLGQGRILPSLGTALLCLVYSIPLLALMAARPLLGGSPIVSVCIALGGGLCYGGLWLVSDRRLWTLTADMWRGPWARRPSA